MSGLTLSHVTKEFGTFKAVNNVSLSVPEGTFVCLLGPSGCGKTTLMRMVAGLDLPTEGSITLGGEDITRVPTHKRNLGMVFQSPILFPGTVADNLAVADPADDPGGRVPFVLVVPADPNDLVPAMRLGGRPGVSVLARDEAPGYRPLPQVRVPDAAAYLLVEVDTGSDLRGVPPSDAFVVVRSRGRTPLTVAEGLALVTVRPDVLRPNRCFSLLASRDGSRRVPAIWISDRRPKLGWCWDGNPHTWLGSASAAARLDGVSAAGR